MLDTDFRETESYYNSYEFEKKWRQVTARPEDGEAESILWIRTFPASVIENTAKQDSVRVYKYKIEYARNMNKMAAELYRCLGKNLPSEIEFNFLKSQYPNHPLPPNYRELVSTLMRTLEKEKDIKKANEDFERGIISKKLSKAIANLRQSSYDEYHRYRNDIRELDNLGVINFTKEKWGKELTFEDVELIDTIPNPWNRRKLMLQAIKDDENGPYKGLQSLLWKDLNGDDWNWIEDEEPKEKRESYPISVEYKYYESHPEYRFTPEVYENIMHFAFDDKGNLQRVLMPKYDMYWQYMGRNDSDVGMAIARMAYENNDHDIKSAQPSTQKYVRVGLGLEELTGKARAQADKASKEMANALGKAVKDDIRYGKSKKGKAAAQKNAAKFFGAMLSAASANHDEAGSGWFSQIKHDYWDILKLGPYRMERISDTSIKYIYVNKELKPIIEMIVKYYTAAPYEVKSTVTAKRIN